MKKNDTKYILRNIALSIWAQVISLLVSFVLNLIVPKFISEYQYAYWQTYMLYVGYVGILHFGLLDGIVLRYSHYDYDELDKEKIRSQFILLLISTSILALTTCFISVCTFKQVYKTVFIFVAIGIVTKNLMTFSCYSLQITSRINKYASVLITQRITNGIFVIILLLFKIDSFVWYCIADLFGDILGLCLAFYYNRELIWGKLILLSNMFSEWKANVTAGSMLMLSNWSALLLIGGAKTIIQLHWGDLVFGQISFSFSVANLFLTFITAISIVLFPSLKRMDHEVLPNVYFKIRNLLMPTLFLALLFYFPGCWVLNKFLPAYSASLKYLGALLPIIIYTSKSSLLTNNYLKAYRKEKLLLYINAVFTGIALPIFCVAAYVINDLNAVFYSIIIVMVLNSFVSEMTVMRLIDMNIIKDFIAETIMTLAFITCTTVFPFWIACGVYAIILVFYYIYNRESIKNILLLVRDTVKGRKR